MSLFAHYDPEKDRIVGAKPGSLVYLHEEGHRVQNRTGFIAYVRMFQFTAILFILAIITAWRDPRLEAHYCHDFCSDVGAYSGNSCVALRLQKMETTPQITMKEFIAKI